LETSPAKAAKPQARDVISFGLAARRDFCRQSREDLWSSLHR
jgi:hypothetical protein